MKKQSCQSSIKHTCGTKNYAACVEYQTELPEFSELECPSIEETTEELYDLVGEIKEETDLSELGEKCLEYLLDENDKIVVKNVLLKFEEKICELEEKVNELKTVNVCNQSITSCNLDFGDLVDACGSQPTTLAETLQLILDTLNTP